MAEHDTIKALTVRQPWAWLLMHGTKDVENRNWPTRYRGWLAIHAAKGMTRAEYQAARLFVAGFDRRLADCIPRPGELARGAIIGTMMLRDCVRQRPSPWFTGEWGWVLDTPQPCDPIEAAGALGLWGWRIPR